MTGKTTTNNDATELLDGLTVHAAAHRAEFDVERYSALLEGSDLTEAQKGQFLEALWSVIVAFVDLGFGVHPSQVVGERGEYDEEIFAEKQYDKIEYVE